MKLLFKLALVSGGCLAAAPALAHTGGRLTAGAAMVHPFVGVDHLLAMIGVGILAAHRQSGIAWTLPVAFVAALVIGLFSGLSGVTLPAAEPGILASLIVFGLLIASGARLALPFVLAATALFGFAHGTAHGIEAVGAPAVYLAAFVGTTAALHGAGWVFGRATRTWAYGRLASGLTIGAAGLALAIG